MSAEEIIEQRNLFHAGNYQSSVNAGISLNLSGDSGVLSIFPSLPFFSSSPPLLLSFSPSLLLLLLSFSPSSPSLLLSFFSFFSFSPSLLFINISPFVHSHPLHNLRCLPFSEAFPAFSLGTFPAPPSSLRSCSPHVSAPSCHRSTILAPAVVVHNAQPLPCRGRCPLQDLHLPVLRVPATRASGACGSQGRGRHPDPLQGGVCCVRATLSLPLAHHFLSFVSVISTAIVIVNTDIISVCIAVVVMAVIVMAVVVTSVVVVTVCGVVMIKTIETIIATLFRAHSCRGRAVCCRC